MLVQPGGEGTRTGVIEEIEIEIEKMYYVMCSYNDQEFATR